MDSQREVRKDERIERLEKLVAAFKQAAFGRKSEKADPEQFDLALEDLETAIAAVHAEDEADRPSDKPRTKPRSANRGSLPAHLPRIEEIIEPERLICSCGGGLHCIGEDVSERLDVIPAQFRAQKYPILVLREPGLRTGARVSSMNSLVERFRSAIRASKTGRSSNAVRPTQSASVERSRSMPWRLMIWACR